MAERQLGPLSDIRSDHLQRYLFAARRIPQGSTVLDLACGCGYGSWMMQNHGLKVTGVDISDEAIAYARANYAGPEYIQKDGSGIEGKWDYLVSFETLEHLEKPENILLSVQVKHVIASVPNEIHFPFSRYRSAGEIYPHRRHYTPEEFEDLLETTGHLVEEKFCQKSKWAGDIEPGVDGKYLIYIAR